VPVEREDGEEAAGAGLQEVAEDGADPCGNVPVSGVARRLKPLGADGKGEGQYYSALLLPPPRLAPCPGRRRSQRLDLGEREILPRADALLTRSQEGEGITARKVYSKLI
jgi:hypothetical protein